MDALRVETVQAEALWERVVTALRRDVESALREGRIGYEESGRLLRFYEEGLHGYTYLETV